MNLFKKMDCFIAFLDILGFKEMVEQNETQKLLNFYENAFLIPLQLAASGGAVTYANGANGAQAFADLSKAKVECLIISDSVLIWSPDHYMTSFIDLCVTVGKAIVMGIYTGIPLRGTITKGEIGVFDASLSSSSSFKIHSVVGKSIVNAFREEKCHEWAGCTIDDQCVDAYNTFYEQLKYQHPDLASVDDLIQKGIIVRYPAPHKQTVTERWVIDWPRLNRTPPDAHTITNCFKAHGKSITDPSVQLKLDNTIAFAQFSSARRTD